MTFDCNSDCEWSKKTREVSWKWRWASLAFDQLVDTRDQWPEAKSPGGDGKCRNSAVEDTGGAGCVGVKTRV